MKFNDLTYSEAIEQVMIENGNFAPLKLIYDNIEKFRKKTGKTPDNTIQERVQRDNRFTRISKGVYGLTEFLEKVYINDLGNFDYDNDKIVFKKRKITEQIVEQKIRIGQNDFRNNLFKEMNSCPITGINEKRLLIASHIKPWVHCDNEERLNPKNGFLLSPLYDKLFDKSVGLITFNLNKEVLLSKKILNNYNIKRLNIEHKQVFENLPVKGREEFLEYHQKHIFQK
ncbi:HNH endonuclease [Flavobacterium sp.]|uniref:HNH endonuclease n=1 Tax=Flavobacterium sp. TaxID=239 RepID=UPI003750D4B1